MAETIVSPFADDAAPIAPSIRECVSLEFDVKLAGQAFVRSAIQVANRCRYPIAVLTSPAEVRIRRSITDRFPEQSLLTAVHATFYVAPREVGLSQQMFLGEGGKAIYHSPGYVSVQSNETVSIPIIGAERLFLNGRSGERELAIETRVVPLSVYRSHAEPFDLSLDVTAFNRMHAAHNSQEMFRLSGHVREITARTTY